MDSTGWRAHRKAHKDEYYYRMQGRRGPDGSFLPVEEVGPLPDGSLVSGPPLARESLYSRSSALQFPTGAKSGHDLRTETSMSGGQTDPAYLAQLPAGERSRLQRVPRMEPHLQFMVGPLLRYDTVDENGLWHGAALIVTADSGSSYEPHPVLTYQWDPEERAQPRDSCQNPGLSFNLGPHPADPHSTATSPHTPENDKLKSGTIGYQMQCVTGQEIYVHTGKGGTFTFWRFPIRILLGNTELCIRYSINNSIQLSFYVPAINQNMRWATYSCNGFSAGVNQEEFKGPGYQNGYDPMWFDLLREHAKAPFHVLVGGGDQLYCDSEPEMQDWIHQPKTSVKLTYPLSVEMSACMDRFYFNHYCACFRNGAFARANSSIPMLNMCDDHDLIDGFGSYPDDLQSSPVFLAIGSRAYFFYLLFQCFINPYIDGFDDRQGAHPFKSLILGVQGPYVGLPSHTFLAYMGPNVRILMLDCRAERTKDRVCGDEEYKKAMEAVSHMPPHVEHLIIQLGIPIAYPRMVFLENALESKLNPLTAIGRSGRAFSGFVNKFNAEPELLDDLNDHWTAKTHKNERNWFIQQLQGISRMKRVRITFLSGDVHCAAVGVLKTLSGKDMDIPPASDYRYMVNVVTSAIVNTPPPTAVIAVVSTLATKIHKTLHYAETDETMVPLFTHDPDGTPRLKNKYIMGRRNWCAVWWDPSSGGMVFDIRVEREKGIGESVGYQIRTPAPQWAPGS